MTLTPDAEASLYRERAHLLALLAAHYPAVLVEGADALRIPAPDGHAYWTGAWSGRMPTIYLPDGRKTSALRIAFRLAHGRDPEGNATRTCGNLRCVAAAHLADRPMRLKKETGQ